jgi:hypothetical protein
LNGECLCDQGWAGADCTKRVSYLTSFFSKKWIISGAQWNYLAFEEGLYYQERYELTLKSDLPMDIYITQGSIRDNEPNEFNYDMVFRQQTSFKLSSDMVSSMPKFGLVISVNNFDYYTNTTNTTTVQATFNIYRSTN